MRDGSSGHLAMLHRYSGASMTDGRRRRLMAKSVGRGAQQFGWHLDEGQPHRASAMGCGAASFSRYLDESNFRITGRTTV